MSTKTISVIVKDDSATGGIGGGNSNNEINDNDSNKEDVNKGNSNKTENKMPATGVFASSLGLVSVFTMLSSCWFIGKRKK